MEKVIENTKLTGWGIQNLDRPVIIAGPCSAETEEQVINIARQLHKAGIEILRAGIWKPRTRPNSFEGIGSTGLEWLKNAKEETGMLTTTEVANVKHVYEALKAKIDILWIGARTSVNPFAVQEIADALKGVDIPVMVKNPINPDTKLWMGAIERLQNVGISKIGAIHRGFSSYEQSIYRNVPQWQIPIELKRQMPNIPLFCDPSHICGRRDILQSVSQKAMDLDFDGLMIESHIDPDNAWSDAKQQITPHTLKEIIDNLKVRDARPEGVSLNELEDLRYKIDKYDDELMKLLMKRMECAAAIGRYKKENNMTILQSKRWEDILEKRTKTSREHDLSMGFVTSVFQAIHQESINKQASVLNGSTQSQA